MKSIEIAKDFSEYPAGRVPKDGPYNGERFRKEFLVPALREAIAHDDKVTVILDGVRSFGSSFLEEAFGGLVRCEGYSNEDVLSRLCIVSKSAIYKRYERAIEKHIKSAKQT